MWRHGLCSTEMTSKKRFVGFEPSAADCETVSTYGISRLAGQISRTRHHRKRCVCHKWRKERGDIRDFGHLLKKTGQRFDSTHSAETHTSSLNVVKSSHPGWSYCMTWAWLIQSRQDTRLRGEEGSVSLGSGVFIRCGVSHADLSAIPPASVIW